MPFPEIERVIYQKNPLKQVICQLRFPPILRIEAEMPAAFQDKIRNDYPLMRERTETRPPREMLDLIPPAVVDSLLRANRGAYEFISADEEWVVTLTRDFIALTSLNYQRWEHFREKLKFLIETFTKEYSPTFFGRVGLRYQDIIQRSQLGLQDVEWSKLLRSHIAGELASPELKGYIEHVARRVVINLQDGKGKVSIQHGFVKDAEDESDETYYLIDSDFFAEDRTEINDALPLLDFFNRRGGWLFRWCITDQLHNAMGPRPI